MYGCVLGNEGRRKKSNLGDVTRAGLCRLLGTARRHLDFTLQVIWRYQGLDERSLSKGTESFSPPRH